ncbi:MAG: RDD family protein [Bacteroidia bacterium]
MSKKTDEELIKITTVDVESYQPLGVKAAQEEITKRGIDPSKFDNIVIELTNKSEVQNQFTAKSVSTSTRFIHLVVDTIAFYILAILLFMILHFMVNITNDAIVYVVLFMAFFLYYGYMETNYQKTIGKFITKTKVVNIDGSKPDSSDIIRRTFCRLIPFDQLSFLFTANGFHDRLSETTIIKD